MGNAGLMHPGHRQGGAGARSARLTSSPLRLSPAFPVVVQNLHVERSGPLSHLVADSAHAHDPQGGPRHFLTHPVHGKVLCVW